MFVTIAREHRLGAHVVSCNKNRPNEYVNVLGQIYLSQDQIERSFRHICEEESRTESTVKTYTLHDMPSIIRSVKNT